MGRIGLKIFGLIKIKYSKSTKFIVVLKPTGLVFIVY